MSFLSIDQAIAHLRAGKFLIVIDDEGRENEGDLVIAAQHATAERVNFLARHGRGLICVAMTGARLDALDLPLMVPPEQNGSGFGTAFTVSVEARDGVTTGISAHDRSHTMRLLADSATEPVDLTRPGHVFPLRARDGGVLERAGHTEASVDLLRLAGLEPAAAICEILAEDGSMARLPQLERFAAQHDIGIVTIADLIAWRERGVAAVQRGPATRLPTRHGEFRMITYANADYAEPDVALSMGDIDGGDPVLVRLHSECLTGDVFGSHRCDCGEQLQTAMAHIATAGRGVVLYLRQEGRGIGLVNKVRAYALQDAGLDTVEANEALGFAADLRSWNAAAAMLRDLGIHRVRLLTNNPRKVQGLVSHGIEVVERLPVVTPPVSENRRYLETKQQKLGHLIA